MSRSPPFVRQAANPSDISPSRSDEPMRCPPASPQFLKGWVAFNCEKWKLKSTEIRIGADALGECGLRAILYLDHQGRVRFPPMGTYLPISMMFGKSDSNRRREAWWLSV